MEFRNSDDTLHNVRVSHEETRTSAFNVAIPTGESYTYTFERDGFYRVGCDIHPAMAASVFAASSPFTTVAGARRQLRVRRRAGRARGPSPCTPTASVCARDVEVAGGRDQRHGRSSAERHATVRRVSAGASAAASSPSAFTNQIPVVSQPAAPRAVSTFADIVVGRRHRDRVVVPRLPDLSDLHGAGREKFGSPLMICTFSGVSRLTSRSSTGTASLRPRF